MRYRLAMGCATLALASVLGLAQAAEDAAKKEVTLTGSLMCAHCNLKEKDFSKCQDVLQVKDGDKTTNYYLTGVPKKQHVCSGSKEGVTVTGTESEKDGKHWIAVSKVEGGKTKEGGTHED